LRYLTVYQECFNVAVRHDIHQRCSNLESLLGPGEKFSALLRPYLLTRIN